MDKQGNLGFLLSAKAATIFSKTLKARNSRSPRAINVDKHAAYPILKGWEGGESYCSKGMSAVYGEKR